MSRQLKDRRPLALQAEPANAKVITSLLKATHKLSAHVHHVHKNFSNIHIPLTETSETHTHTHTHTCMT